MKKTKAISKLHLETLLEKLSSHFCKIPSTKDCPATKHNVSNVVIATLAMLFVQDPSLAQYQRRMQIPLGKSNLLTLLGVTSIPEETQFRRLLDDVSPEHLLEGLHKCILYFQKTNYWKKFRYSDGRYIVLIDATETHRSQKVHCKHCLTYEHKDGRIEYAHKALVATLVHPDIPFVIPLLCEEIRNGDGTSKQDCEFNAAKRLLPKLARTYNHLDMIIVGDGLFSKTTMVSLCNTLGLNYIFVAKPGDHKTMMKDIEGLRKPKGAMKSFSNSGMKNTKNYYEYLSTSIPIASDTEVESNWFGLRQDKLSKDGKTSKQTYKNTWITSLKLTPKSVEIFAIAGRSRSKIENETFNALKNHGYHLEHNYGHGKHNLAFNMIVLNIIAFLLHQLLNMIEKPFIMAIDYSGTRKMFFGSLKFGIQHILWPDWRYLLEYLAGRKEPIAPT